MPESRRSPTPVFQPRFTLSLLYLLFFFLLYSLLLVMPELWEVMQSIPPGPEQERAAQEAARAAARPRLPIALALTLLTLWAGARWGRLPGLGRRLRRR